MRMGNIPLDFESHSLLRREVLSQCDTADWNVEDERQSVRRGETEALCTGTGCAPLAASLDLLASRPAGASYTAF